jgi:SAM-dependent methyltransferase
MTPSDQTGLPFGLVAESYALGRPGYPDVLVGDVLDFGGVEVPRVLEVGAGTGKATALFASRGADIVAIEPSPQMIALARSGCAAYPNVAFVVATFEEWPLEPDSFDLVVSAQAWHWVSRDARYIKAKDALHPDGALALFWTHPLWGQCPMTAALTAVYDRLAPELCARGPWFPGYQGPAGAERPTDEELAGLFGALTERRYQFSVTYTTHQYLELLRSLAEHESLTSARRDHLFARLQQEIDALDGIVDMEYETRLYMTRPSNVGRPARGS